MKTKPDTTNSYDRDWNPRAYLRQYYSQAFIPDDEEAIYQRLIAYLQRRGRVFARALDFGCGPTVHLLTPLAPWVTEMHLADYLPGNLAEVGKWLRAEADAHDWDNKIRRALEIETRGAVSDEALAARKRLLRGQVTALKHCDVRQPQPLGAAAVYDLVLSAYCVDAATSDKDEWRRWLGHLLTLCATGGTVVLVSARKSAQYQVGDQLFPEASVDETDIAAALAAAGFDPGRILIEAVPLKTWADVAFDGIVIAMAEKRDGRGSW